MSDSLRSFLKGERHRLIGYVRSLISETAALEAEDIVQDVLLKLIEKRDDLPPLERLGAYTYRALRNRVIDKLRGRRDFLSFDQERDGQITLFDLVPVTGPEPDWSVQTEQGRVLLFEALETLKEMEREVVISHELEGLSFAEMSEKMGVPQNTLLSHKARGMTKLKVHFSKLNGGL